jgi:hypothetical protein
VQRTEFVIGSAEKFFAVAGRRNIASLCENPLTGAGALF